MRGNDSRPTFESLGGITVFLAPWPYSNTSMNSLYMSPITVSETIATKKEISRAQIRHLRCRQNFAIRRAYYLCRHAKYDGPQLSQSPVFPHPRASSYQLDSFFLFNPEPLYARPQFRVSGWNCGSVSPGALSDNDQLYPTLTVRAGPVAPFKVFNCS